MSPGKRACTLDTATFSPRRQVFASVTRQVSRNPWCTNNQPKIDEPLHHRILRLRRVRETHTFFAAAFCVPDCHTFSRRQTSGSQSERNGRALCHDILHFSVRVFDSPLRSGRVAPRTGASSRRELGDVASYRECAEAKSSEVDPLMAGTLGADELGVPPGYNNLPSS